MGKPVPAAPALPLLNKSHEPQESPSRTLGGPGPGLRVAILRWPLQAAVYPLCSESLAPLPGAGSSGAAPPFCLQLPKELWLWGTGTGESAGSLPCHPNRTQAAGPHELCRKGCLCPLCHLGGAMVHPGARLFPRLGQPGFSRRGRKQVSIPGERGILVGLPWLREQGR